MTINQPEEGGKGGGGKRGGKREGTRHSLNTTMMASRCDEHTNVIVVFMNSLLIPPFLLLHPIHFLINYYNNSIKTLPQPSPNLPLDPDWCPILYLFSHSANIEPVNTIAATTVFSIWGGRTACDRPINGTPMITIWMSNVSQGNCMAASLRRGGGDNQPPCTTGSHPPPRGNPKQTKKQKT